MASAWTAANPFGLTISRDAIGRRDELKRALAQADQQLTAPVADTEPDQP
jgi:hypothetical protein